MDAADPLSVKTEAADQRSLDDLCHDLASLQDLATRGLYRTILDKIATARNLSLLTKPHEHLTYLAFSVLSLFKLRRYDDALKELKSVDDLDTYRYESYPGVYVGRTGSMVPFALRWLHALIPGKVGEKAEAVDRLYRLLDFVRDRMSKNGNSSIWERREAFVVNSIVSHHLGQKEFTVALGLIKGLMRSNKEGLDPVLLSKLGYIQMQIGDLEGAKGTFSKVEGLVEHRPDDIGLKNLVGRNKALGYLVGKDYLSAVREYEECIERDGADVVAINNKAICLMYLRELSGSITVLEGALERVPTVALNEPLVVNLCSMYELAYVNHLEIKKTLSSWIARVAPDDFDTSCTRI